MDWVFFFFSAYIHFIWHTLSAPRWMPFAFRTALIPCNIDSQGFEIHSSEILVRIDMITAVTADLLAAHPWSQSLVPPKGVPLDWDCHTPSLFLPVSCQYFSTLLCPVPPANHSHLISSTAVTCAPSPNYHLPAHHKYSATPHILCHRSM